ncbi:MAG TPA: TonB-dependent siderophore receptor, partial [Rhodanobacter sp.]
SLMSNAFRRAHALRAPRISVLAAALLLATQVHAQSTGEAAATDKAADKKAATELGAVRVVAQRAERVSNGATNLDLDIKDTPQSISVVSSGQMQAFGANSVNDALRLATGIQVEEWETNRTNYLSRGFEIENTQVDGVGLPNDWGIATGATDSYGYDKIEVIRGANGLLTGVGNAAGTINYVRKRPTNTEQGEVGISYGSWGTRRVEADYSTPFTKDGTWAGRVVAVHQDGDSYLRGLDDKRDFLYGVVDGQVGENGTLTLGYSYQRARTNGNMWGALTFDYDDGRQAEWPRGASTTQDWTHWNTATQNAFAEYSYQLADDWQLKLSYNHNEIRNDDQLFFAYSLAGIDPATGLGLYGWPYKGRDVTTANLGEATVNGDFQLFGRDQQVVLGVSVAQSEYTLWDYPVSPSDPAFGALPAFPYAGNAIAQPEWGARAVDSTLNQRLKRAFGVTRLALTDRLKAVVGFNYAQFHRDGVNSGVLFDQTESHVSPYGGLTYDFTDHVLGYVSYSDIYQPQDQYDIHHVYLDPTKGTNYEVGIKADWLDKRLLTTLAWFDAKQQNLGTYAGLDPSTGSYYYTGVDVESKGVEFEATGKLNRYADLVFGYTALKMSGQDGGDTYPWVPRHTANLALSTRVPGFEALSFGVGGRWQSATSNVDGYTGYTVRQGSYALVNAFAAWDVLPKLTLRANVNNIGDKKYITSLYNIGYYGAPTNYMVSLDWRF